MKSPATQPSKTALRPEIQALRAIAVLSVVLYHFWPHALKGGYVGVDIFFVISGFLITGQLLRMKQRTGKISLWGFWAGRLRRLLPAALLVVILTSIGIAVWVPQNFWPDFFTEGSAAAAYFVNWVLAANSVDYLHAGTAVSPFQHYWSLSVEEQFYLVWPLLFIVAILATRKAPKRFRKWLLCIIGLATGLSLLWSILSTIQSPSVAYFSTFTRGWEFGVGGILALLPANRPGQTRRAEGLHTAARWVGTLAILVSLLTFSADTPFPSYMALLPVVGALLFIWGGMPNTRWALNPLVRFKPVQWLGDCSYSLYLWHWPATILFAYAAGHEPDLKDHLVLLVACIAVAGLSKRFIEDPIRHWPVLLKPHRLYLTYGATAMTMLVAVACGMIPLHIAQSQAAQVKASAQKALRSENPCVGARSMSNAAHCPSRYTSEAFFSSLFASDDQPPDNYLACAAGEGFTPIDRCQFGAQTSKQTIALVGDSHALRYLPDLDIWAKKHNYRLVTYVKDGCALISTKHIAPRWDATSQDVKGCVQATQTVQSTLTHMRTLKTVIFANRTQLYRGTKHPLTAQKIHRTVKTLHAHHIRSILVRDVPERVQKANAATASGPECVEKSHDPAKDCSIPRGRVLSRTDPMVAASARSGASLLDLSNAFCDETRCYSLIGGVSVYQDDNHLSATFAASLEPTLDDALTKIVEK